jgi:predicted lipase
MNVAFDKISKEIVVFFRGSATISDWVNNARLIQKPVFGKPYDKAIVHRGFLRYAKQFNAELDNHLSDLIKKHPLANVHFIGHSMGGAVGSSTFDYRRGASIQQRFWISRKSNHFRRTPCW